MTGVQLHRCPSRLHMQLLQTPAQQLKDKDLAERARVSGEPSSSTGSSDQEPPTRSAFSLFWGDVQMLARVQSTES